MGFNSAFKVLIENLPKWMGKGGTGGINNEREEKGSKKET